DAVEATDTALKFDLLTAYVDELSAPYLEDAEIDFVTDQLGSQHKWLGRGDKNTADGAAVNAMRIMLNQVNIDGTIVIGEGEIDEA
ncbi:fructose-bisphosphatase class II, partial [Salmonella enterica subsp. enterica serovar Montevideo]|nr:fructose-bisphosphatase class II [Salmonella enterica subsp. enterica serovar Montevideo]